MADDPMVAAARHLLLRDQLPLLRECVADAPSEALNWRPGGADTNSIAVLATHTMHSLRSWMSVALGAPLPDRDRESEFRVTVDAASELLAMVDALTADVWERWDEPRALPSISNFPRLLSARHANSMSASGLVCRSASAEGSGVKMLSTATGSAA